MLCPQCHGAICERSHRRSLRDYLASGFGTRPWRCRTCDARFYAWRVPVNMIGYVHCPKCGRLDVEKIARRLVTDDPFRWIKKLCGFAAYRCDKCRERFLSVRLYHPIQPLTAARSSESAKVSHR